MSGEDVRSKSSGEQQKCTSKKEGKHKRPSTSLPSSSEKKREKKFKALLKLIEDGCDVDEDQSNFDKPLLPPKEKTEVEGTVKTGQDFGKVGVS